MGTAITVLVFIAVILVFAAIAEALARAKGWDDW